jgi:hypothetical protein
MVPASANLKIEGHYCSHAFGASIQGPVSCSHRTPDSRRHMHPVLRGAEKQLPS